MGGGLFEGGLIKCCTQKYIDGESYLEKKARSWIGGPNEIPCRDEERKNIKYSFKKLIEKKNTLNHFELNVDRDSTKEGKVVKTVVRVKY